MLNEIKKALEGPLSEIGVVIDEISFEKNQLNIIIDAEVLNIDIIIKATKVINPILDKKDFIKQKYVLDVSSKEKGGNNNE